MQTSRKYCGVRAGLGPDTAASNTQEQHWAYKEHRSITRLTHVSQNVPGPSFIQHICLGLESGNFRQNRHRPYTPLHELITKAHEAHFRVELYLALTKKSFRHHNTTSASSERIRLFNLAIASVREGREKYMKKAVETRMQNRTPKQIEDSERVTEQEVGSDDNANIDENDL